MKAKKATRAPAPKKKVGSRQRPRPAPVVGVRTEPQRAPGTYKLAELRQSQCRFACTPDDARPAEHRFCGNPVVGHGSWCAEHLKRVASPSGMGGRSFADLEADAAERAAKRRAA